MSHEHASDSNLLDLAAYEMRVPEAAILQRHLRRCPECNERYRVITAYFPDSMRLGLLDDHRAQDAR